MSEVPYVLRPSESAFRFEPHQLDEPSFIRFRRQPPPPPEPASDTQVRTQSRRGLWALTDQGIVSLGNCATNVMLARWLAVEQFGVFAILLEAMLFLNTLQSALLIYPLSVRGAVLDREGLRKLAGTCMTLTAILLIPLGLAIVLGAGMKGVATTGALAAIALGLWQCQETLRRAMMAHAGFKQTILGDAVSYLGQAAGVLVLGCFGLLTVNTAFAAIGISSALALLVQSWQVGPNFATSAEELAKRGLEFWRLSKWVVTGNLTLIITTLGCSWTLAYFHGANAVGKFQALANLMKLSNPLTICMAGLIVPAAARAFNSEGIRSARLIALRYGLLTCAVLAPYYLFLLLVPTAALRLLYGSKSAYLSLGNELRAFVLWYAALLIAQIAGCLLNAIEQSRRSFIAQIVQTIAVIAITLPLTAHYGLDGLLIGGVISNFLMAACYMSMVRRLHEPLLAVFTRRVKQEMHDSSRVAA